MYKISTLLPVVANSLEAHLPRLPSESILIMFPKLSLFQSDIPIFTGADYGSICLRTVFWNDLIKNTCIICMCAWGILGVCISRHTCGALCSRFCPSALRGSRDWARVARLLQQAPLPLAFVYFYAFAGPSPKLPPFCRPRGRKSSFRCVDDDVINVLTTLEDALGH